MAVSSVRCTTAPHVAWVTGRFPDSFVLLTDGAGRTLASLLPSMLMQPGNEVILAARRKDAPSNAPSSFLNPRFSGRHAFSFLVLYGRIWHAQAQYPYGVLAASDA